MKILICLISFLAIIGCISSSTTTSPIENSPLPSPIISIPDVNPNEVQDNTSSAMLLDNEGNEIRPLEPEESSLGIPVLCEEEYFEYIDNVIIQFANDNSLFLFRFDSRLPYHNYYFVSGEYVDENTYRSVSLSGEEYEKLYQEFKQCLLDAMSKKALEHGTGFFSRPGYQVIGLFLYNPFIKEPNPEIQREKIGSYQVDLMSYYYQDITEEYIKMEDFENSPWDKWNLVK